MLKLMERKIDNPKLALTQLAKPIVFSDGTIRSYRRDINMNSLNNRKNTEKTLKDFLLCRQM